MAMTDNKLQFLYGLSTNLPEDLKAGTVYVTTDEHVMYVDLPGSGNTTERLRLSDFIWVDSRAKLPAVPPDQTKGLYYIADENILASYDTISKTWVQINAHPELNQIVINHAATLTNVTNGAQVKLTASGSNGQDAFPKFSFQVVTGQTETTQVTLKDGKIAVTSADTIKTTGVAVSSEADNNLAHITFSETTSGHNADGSAKTATSEETAKVTISGTGLTVTQTENEINLNANPAEVKVGFNGSGVLTADVIMPGAVGATKVTGVTPTVKVGCNTIPTTNEALSNTTKATASFINGVADLSSVYTAAQVEERITSQLKVANAMVFKGTVGGATKLPASIEHGATYIVNASGHVLDAAGVAIKDSEGSAINMKIGDMLIASGAETDGVITNITWNYVPSGDDAEVTTQITFDANSMAIAQNYSGQVSPLGTLEVGDGLAATQGTKKLTIAHKVPESYAANGTTGTSDSTTDADGVHISAIKEITRDSYGHVIGYKTVTYNLPDETLATFGNTVAVASNVATVTSQIVHTSGSNASATLKVETSGESALAVEAGADNKSIKLDLYWGSF